MTQKTGSRFSLRSVSVESSRQLDGRPVRLVTFGFAATILVGLLASPYMSAQGPSSSSGSRNAYGNSRGPAIYEGFTEPQHDIMVAAAEIGRLEQIHVKVGDRVEKGQVIGQLENALQLASVKIAKLQAVMTGEWEAAKAEAQLNQARTEKLRALASDRMARPDELRRAEADLRIALARQMSTEEQLRLRGLELERYMIQLRRREIRSPMSGIVSKVFRKPGEYITPGDPAIIRLLVMAKVEAVFNVPVEDVIAMSVGDPVTVTLQSSTRSANALVSSIAPDIDGESGTVQVRVELDNADGRLLSGDRCTMRLRPQRRRSASLVSPLNEEGQRK